LHSFDRLYTIQKNGGTDTKPMGQIEPQFLSDPMSDRKIKFLPTLAWNITRTNLLVSNNVRYDVQEKV
jgi:hypothetical protein